MQDLQSRFCSGPLLLILQKLLMLLDLFADQVILLLTIKLGITRTAAMQILTFSLRRSLATYIAERATTLPTSIAEKLPIGSSG